MISLNAEALAELPSRKRATLINNLCGLRSANLIATRGVAATNLAIFNSVIHLGSDPAIIGIVFRPLTVERHTYDNIKEFKSFTVNAVSESIVAKAHQTSAKYPETVSEFEAVGLTPQYREETHLPFVAESPIQLLCSYSQEHVLENGCVLLTARIESVYIEQSALDTDMFVDHSKAHTMAIGGLDAYYRVTLEGRYAYAKVDEGPKLI
ncbi:MAG: flavin reductase family protein [Flavobacteriaceae bacterium]